MIKSMTGFGRYEASNDFGKFIVELKAVNHRYLDVSIRMPRKLQSFETAVRSLIKEQINRGKIDLYISLEEQVEASTSLTYHPQLAAEYVNYFQQMADAFGIENDLTVSKLAACPDVFTMEEVRENEEGLFTGLKEAVEGACLRLVESRLLEGERLYADFLTKLDTMESYVAQIEKESPRILADYRRRLEEKVSELLGDVKIEEGRLAAEVVLFADKICTDEETVRLRSHILHMKETLEIGTEIGRKMDFIAQEMNREANTILSKANDIEVSNYAIGLKTEIEKVREQIQNIE